MNFGRVKSEWKTEPQSTDTQAGYSSQNGGVQSYSYAPPQGQSYPPQTQAPNPPQGQTYQTQTPNPSQGQNYQTPSYQPQVGSGMSGVQGADQSPTVRLGRGALPASAQGAGGASWAGGAQQTPGTTSHTAGTDEESYDAGNASYLRKLLRTELVQNNNQIEIIRNDPTSPLYSVKSFEELNLPKPLLDGVYGMGFNKPSKIQETALPILLANPPCNLIAQSQSGTGKTAAFVLSMLTRVNRGQNFPQILCLSPTYDLARQTGEVLLQMGKYLTDIKVVFALKGEHKFGARHQITEQIIIGTPGTTLDWIKRKFFDPSAIVMFVLDEADVMIATQGHQDQTVRIHKNLREGIQGVLFSATYDDHVMKFASTIIPNSTIIKLKREEESLDSIGQYYINCKEHEDKYQALANIYAFIDIGQAIVFCQTRKSAHFLAGKMTKDGHSVAILSGEMDISSRVAVLNRFREGKDKLMITTNLCARGLDIEQITLVINYDLPLDLMGNTDFETYLHRIGRTGRFGKKGIAINFIDGPDSMQRMQMIQQHFGRTIKRLEKDDYEQLENIAV